MNPLLPRSKKGGGSSGWSRQRLILIVFAFLIMVVACISGYYYKASKTASEQILSDQLAKWDIEALSERIREVHEKLRGQGLNSNQIREMFFESIRWEITENLMCFNPSNSRRHRKRRTSVLVNLAGEEVRACAPRGKRRGADGSLRTIYRLNLLNGEVLPSVEGVCSGKDFFEDPCGPTYDLLPLTEPGQPAGLMLCDPIPSCLLYCCLQMSLDLSGAEWGWKMFRRDLKLIGRTDLHAASSLTAAILWSRERKEAERRGTARQESFSGEDEIGRLIMKGYDVNATDRFGTTPLMLASQRARVGCVEELLDGGASIHMVDKRGRTAVFYALSQLGNYYGCPIVKLLLERGADPNVRDDKGWTPLMKASWSGCEKVVQALLDYGADLSLRDSKGFTALAMATLNNQTGAVTLLKNHGATE